MRGKVCVFGGLIGRTGTPGWTPHVLRVLADMSKQRGRPLRASRTLRVHSLRLWRGLDIGEPESPETRGLIDVLCTENHDG
jgi:hypothetical protein